MTSGSDQIKAKVTVPVIAGLYLTLVAPLLWGFVIVPLVKPLLSPQTYVMVYEMVQWGLTFGVLAVVVFWERQPLSSIGVRGLSCKEGLLALLLGVALFLLSPVLLIIMTRVFGVSMNTTAVIGKVAKLSIVPCILMAFEAGVTEEIIQRAYPIERIRSLTGKTWVGALVSLVVFTVLHIPGWGWGHSIGIVFPTGLILTVLYIWKRNLALNIIVHFLVDFISFVVVPLLPPLPL